MTRFQPILLALGLLLSLACSHGPKVAPNAGDDTTNTLQLGQDGVTIDLDGPSGKETPPDLSSSPDLPDLTDDANVTMADAGSPDVAADLGSPDSLVSSDAAGDPDLGAPDGDGPDSADATKKTFIVDGDLTGDGKVNVADVVCQTLVNQWLEAGGEGPLPECAKSLEITDLNCDGKIDSEDTLLRIALAMGTPFDPAIDANGDNIHDACQ